MQIWFELFPDMSYVVIGGGLSGLSAAFYLKSLRKAKKILVLESSPRLGGWVQTTWTENGSRHEHGPRTVRPSGPAGVNTLKLVSELGIADEIVPVSRSHPSAQNRLVLVDGQLHKLPSNLMSLVQIQKPFTKPLFLAGIRDLLVSAKKCQDDSIYEFVERRFGPELAKFAIDPMVRGICAGNSREISAASFVTGSLFQMEQNHGGILKGFLKKSILEAFRPQKKVEASNEIIERSIQENWSVWSLKKGLESLVDHLAKRLDQDGVEIKKNVQVQEILKDDHGVRVVSNLGDIVADHVFLATPAFAASNILNPKYPDIGHVLQEIPYVTVAVVTLEFNRKVCETQAFGFLVPSDQPEPILGTIFDTCGFPQGDKEIFTVMMGGHWFQELFGSDPDIKLIEKMAVKEVQRILHIEDEPELVIAKIQKNCIAQYTIGHKQRIEKVRSLIAKEKLPFSVVGTSYDGVGLNDGILSSRNAVQKLQS